MAITLEVTSDNLVLTETATSINVTEQAGNTLTVTQPASSSVIEVINDAPANLVFTGSDIQLVVQSNDNTVQVVNTPTANVNIVDSGPAAVIEIVTAGPAGAPGVDGQDGADGAEGPQGPPGMTTLADLPAGTTVSAVFSTTWPNRPTARTDIVVIWIGGTEAPPAALTNDLWVRNA